MEGELKMLTEDQSSETATATATATPQMVAEIAEQEKNYYCQRCLNHGELNPRKGHKPECGYLKCPCPECTMVEQRRQLNNLLSKKKVQCTPTILTRNGKRVRDPHCARCSAHGVMVPLRGHKRTMCQFLACKCTLCALVEHRRVLMAAQIKLRRSQQKSRDGKEPKARKSRRGGAHNEMVMTAMSVCVGAGAGAGAGDQKTVDGSSSPSLSSTDTMSPSLSLSPPSSPPPPPLLAPIPVYPPFPHCPTVPLQLHVDAQQNHFELNQLVLQMLQSKLHHQFPLLLTPAPLLGGGVPLLASSAPPLSAELTDQFLALFGDMYPKSCLKI